MEDGKIIEKRAYIDPRTGFGIEYVKWKDKKYYDGHFFWRSNYLKYLKVFCDAPIDDSVSDNTWGKFYKIVRLCRDNNILTTHYGKPMWVGDIAKVLGLSSSGAYKLVKEWADNDMVRGISHKGEKLLVVNPAYAMYGKRLSDLAIFVFQDYVFDTIKSEEIRSQIKYSCIAKRYLSDILFILPEKGVFDGQIRIAPDYIEKTRNESS